MSTRSKRSRTTPKSAPAATPAPLRWTGQMHHIFFTLVLPTVFEWCALSDFFMPDELFHAYPEEKNGCVSTRGPFSVAHAVCKDWFVVLYKRLLAHCLRADYDMRVLRNNTGGMLKRGHVMVFDWCHVTLERYLCYGGTQLHKAYISGVELVMTTQHIKLCAKWKLFLNHRGLHRLFESMTSGHSRMRASTMAQRAVREGRRCIKMRSVQIINNLFWRLICDEDKVAVMIHRTNLPIDSRYIDRVTDADGVIYNSTYF